MFIAALFVTIQRRNNPNVCQLMDKENVLYPFNVILFIHKKEQHADTCYKRSEH